MITNPKSHIFNDNYFFKNQYTYTLLVCVNVVFV